jgi:hypothetical protein
LLRKVCATSAELELRNAPSSAVHSEGTSSVTFKSCPWPRAGLGLRVPLSLFSCFTPSTLHTPTTVSPAHPTHTPDHGVPRVCPFLAPYSLTAWGTETCPEWRSSSSEAARQYECTQPGCRVSWPPDISLQNFALLDSPRGLCTCPSVLHTEQVTHMSAPYNLAS